MSESGKPASKRQMQLLAGLGAVLAALLIFQVLPLMMGGAQPPAGTPGASRAAAPAGAAQKTPLGTVEDVRLAKLEQEWPAPGESRRNPFTMAPAPPPPSATPSAPSKPVDAEPAAPAAPPGPPPPPPIPPITLKFIGVISSDSTGKIAGLSDGKFVYRGREGQTIEGRYRIVKIGEESIQIEYVNGTGRQTIRLTGK
jgi:hypothetical protein